MLRLKPFASVFLLCLSVCENSRIKRDPQGILGPIINGICQCPEPQTCPETPTCSETSTCPETPTCPSCPDNNTCPISREEVCAAAGAYFCEFENSCITSRFAATTAERAIQKCSSLSDENMTYSVASNGYNSQEEQDCLSVALPASGVRNKELFWYGGFAYPESNNCYAYNITVDGDVFIDNSEAEKVDCNVENSFFCVGIME